ncbi:hypothetical protein F4780DRAFT_55162 [Xylariomycetidae sp. FL0641]|nr:hypothetical protein F4780DRAFT_55162 [Xylariomycetidae sp. FL0641]
MRCHPELLASLTFCFLAVISFLICVGQIPNLPQEPGKMAGLTAGEWLLVVLLWGIFEYFVIGLLFAYSFTINISPVQEDFVRAWLCGFRSRLAIFAGVIPLWPFWVVYWVVHKVRACRARNTARRRRQQNGEEHTRWTWAAWPPV